MTESLCIALLICYKPWWKSKFTNEKLANRANQYWYVIPQKWNNINLSIMLVELQGFTRNLADSSTICFFFRFFWTCANQKRLRVRTTISKMEETTYDLDYDLYSYDGSQAYSKSVSTNDVGVRIINNLFIFSINNDCGLKKCFLLSNSNERYSCILDALLLNSEL